MIVLADDARDVSDLDAEEMKRLMDESQRSSIEDRDETTEAELQAAMARVDVAR